MGKSLSHLSNEATQATNDTGNLTPILEIQPDSGTFLRFENRVPQGSAPGLPVIMDLRDAGDNPLPTDTKLLFRVERPEDDQPNPVTVAEYNIAAWNQLTTEQQRDTDHIDSAKVELKSSRFNVRDTDILTVDIESSAAIDWANSEFYVVREGVEELPLQG